jgi:hypothetical protein
MNQQWKRWLGAAAVLLLVGAGCEGQVQQEADMNVGADVSGEIEDDGTNQVDPAAPAVTSEIDADIDAAVDAALGESSADADISLEGDADADVLNNDSAELNAYGSTYVESEIR